MAESNDYVGLRRLKRSRLINIAQYHFVDKVVEHKTPTNWQFAPLGAFSGPWSPLLSDSLSPSPRSTLLSSFFPSPLFWDMKPAILLFTLTLFAATALSLKFPVSKLSRHSLSRRAGSATIHTPHNLASSTDALPADAFLGCVPILCFSKAVPLRA